MLLGGIIDGLCSRMMSDITFSKNDESKKDAGNLMGHGGAKIDHGNVTNSKPKQQIFRPVIRRYIHSSRRRLYTQQRRKDMYMGFRSKGYADEEP